MKCDLFGGKEEEEEGGQNWCRLLACIGPRPFGASLFWLIRPPPFSTQQDRGQARSNSRAVGHGHV